MHLARRILHPRKHHRAQERDGSGAARSRRREGEEALSHGSTICGLDATGKGDVRHECRRPRRSAYSRPDRPTQMKANQWLGAVVRTSTSGAMSRSFQIPPELDATLSPLPGLCGGKATELVGTRVRCPTADGRASRAQVTWDCLGCRSTPARRSLAGSSMSCPIAFIASAIAAPRSIVGVGNAATNPTAGPPMFATPIMSAISIHSGVHRERRRIPIPRAHAEDHRTFLFARHLGAGQDVGDDVVHPVQVVEDDRDLGIAASRTWARSPPSSA